MEQDELRPGARNYCDDCGLRLRLSIDSRFFKSCPNCSGFADDHHAFRRYPSEFGTTDPRVSPEHPDGSQSWCGRCRFLNYPHWNGRVNQAEYVRCRDVRDAEYTLVPPKAPTIRKKR